ncbi:MAG: hypothetical protein ACERKD_18855 [Prolixibacteraceae bacterium]
MTKLLLLIAIFLSSLFSSVFAQNKIEKHFYNGEYELALKLLNEKIDDAKATAHDYQMAAVCKLQKFDYQEAIHYFQKGLNPFPDDQALVEGLADAQLSLGAKDEALKGYTYLSLIDSSNTRIQGKQAGVLMDLNRYAEAKSIYASLYMADSSNIYFLRKLMQSRYKLQEYAYVIDLADGNPYYPSNNKELQLLVADCYTKINRNFEALAVLDTILQIDSLYQPAISKLAYIHFGSYRNYEDAVILYRQLNRLENYTDPFHLKNLGICEYFTGNQEYAAVLLDSLVDEIKNDPFVPFYAGLSYNKLGKVDKALELLETASGMIIPDYTGDVYHHLGRAYAAKRMFKEAMETYQKVRMYDSANYQVLYDMAVTYEEWNMNRTLALAFYQQFVKACTNSKSSDLAYAENRIRMIKEELFFEGDK